MVRLAAIFLSVMLVACIGLAQQSTEHGTGDQPVQKLDLKSGMHAPTAIYQPEAEYSQEARQKFIDGKCLIAMVVDINGLPQNVHTVRCSDPTFAQPGLTSTTKYRFRPATSADGKPIAVLIYVEVDFQIDGAPKVVDPIRYGFATPPGITSSAPDANGVYPLTKGTTVPTITSYIDQGYGAMAFASEGKSACDITLTINAKGKPSDPVVLHCDREGLGAPAIKSLMASKYKPASLNGKTISIRALIHLEYGDFPNAKS